jgi:hypothetical protein
VPATRTSIRASRRPRLVPGSGRESAGVVAVLLVAACGFVVLEPWHGPTVLALSEQHGVDAADLPALALIALALAVSRSRVREPRPERNWSTNGRVAAVAAIVLGALLLAGILDPRSGSPLIPAGGGTFGRNTEHVDGLRAAPVDRWTHLAVSYDGAKYRLYVDGVEASSRSASGTILSTTDPLWIGGNRPYGEYFRGLIDEARVYDRALRPAEVQAAMSTPVASRGGPDSAGLVAAYGFNGGGPTATDGSGNGNNGTIRGARPTSAGRFGPGIRFDRPGEVVRVPSSASLNLRSAMTLMAWIRPSEPQSGWRTVLARQTDAYFLAAGGGREGARLVERLDRLRFVLVILLVASIGWALARGHAPWVTGRGRWYWPVALFVAGSLVDVAFAPSDTLIGAALVAVWFGAISSHRDGRVSMYGLSAAFAAVTVLSVADPTQLALPRDAGGVVRSAALGLMLATAGLLSLRRSRRARPAGSGAVV